MREKECDPCHRVIPAKAGIQEGQRRDPGQSRLFPGLQTDGRGMFVIFPA